MRMALDHRNDAAINRALKAMDEHLTSAPLHQATADLLFAAASAVLLGRSSTDHVGWVCHWHGDTAAVHLTAPDVAWHSHLPGNSGRLLTCIDLGWWWQEAAGDEWMLAEAADRAARVAAREERERVQQARRPHQRGTA